MIHDEGAFRDRVTRWMKGNAEATAFVVALHHIVETWDDLIDKDHPVTGAGINRAFYAALVEIPRNSFYQDHFALLNPIVEAAILDWFAANEFEKSKEYDRAWALGSTGLSVTVMCARILGGVEWATRVNVEFRKITEPLQEFVAAFGES